MAIDTTKLREEFATLKASHTALLGEEDKRELTADEQKTKTEQFGKLTSLAKKIKEREDFAAIQISEGKAVEAKDPEGKEEFQAHNANEGMIVVKDSKKVDRVEFGQSLSQWAMTGQIDRKFATITTTSASGILMPVTVGTPTVLTVPNAFRRAFALYGQTPVYTPTTEKLNLPILDGNAGGVVAETANSATENEPTLHGIVLTPDTYQSGVAWVSNLQLGAPGYDLLSYIESALEYSKERGLMNAIADSIVADSNIVKGVDVVNGEPSYNDMVDLNACLDQKYDDQKVMVLSGTVIAGLAKLKSTQGVPLLLQDPQNQNVFKFLDTPILRCDRFSAYDSSEGRVLGCIVSLLAFKLRDAGQRQVLRYAESAKPNQTGLNLCTYHAFGWDVDGMGLLKA